MPIVSGTSAKLNLLMGPMLPVAVSTAVNATTARYEADFTKFADQHWETSAASWEGGNYYDRAFIYYSWYARSGDITYLDRANALAEDYLKNYVEAHDYVVASWWSMPKGLTAHYLLNGDQASLTAIGKMADGVCSPWNSNNSWENLFDSTFSEGREIARTLETLTQAILLDAKSTQGNDFEAKAESLVEKILATVQTADGSRPRFASGTDFEGRAVDKPLMNGLLNEALINYYEQVEADPRIIPMIKKNLDYMWAHEWDATANAFQYVDKDVASGDTDDPAPDLNGLIVTGFGFVYKHTGDTTYLDRGDQVFAGGVDGAWLSGSKQFNQEYAYSLNYLGYTRGEDAPAPSPASSLRSSSVPSSVENTTEWKPVVPKSVPSSGGTPAPKTFSSPNTNTVDTIIVSVNGPPAVDTLGATVTFLASESGYENVLGAQGPLAGPEILEQEGASHTFAFGRESAGLSHLQLVNDGTDDQLVHYYTDANGNGDVDAKDMLVFEGDPQRFTLANLLETAQRTGITRLTINFDDGGSGPDRDYNDHIAAINLSGLWSLASNAGWI